MLMSPKCSEQKSEGQKLWSIDYDKVSANTASSVPKTSEFHSGHRAEVEFVHAVTAGGSVKFLPPV